MKKKNLTDYKTVVCDVGRPRQANQLLGTRQVQPEHWLLATIIRSRDPADPAGQCVLPYHGQVPRRFRWLTIVTDRHGGGGIGRGPVECSAGE